MKKKIFYGGLIIVLFLIFSYFSIGFVVENLGKIIEVIISLIILGGIFSVILLFGVIFLLGFYAYRYSKRKPKRK